MATPLYMNYLEQSKMKVARADSIRLAGELKNFAISHDGEYPPENNWDLLPLEKKPPLDPWSQPYQWGLAERSSRCGRNGPIVWSAGPNKVSGDADDIGNH